MERIEWERLTKSGCARCGGKEKRKIMAEMEDCVKRGLVGLGGEWRMRDGEWRQVVETAVKWDQ